MKRLFGTLAAAALLVTPLTAMAQHGGGGHGMGGGGGWHGGGGMGGGWHGGGSWGGGGWHGGGAWGGGWHGGGWHGGWHGHYCCGFFPFFPGFALGFAAAYPWYYWGDPYWWGPGSYPYGYYNGYYNGYYGPYDGYGAPPPAASAPVACGRWVWQADQSHYQWVPTPCAAPAQAAPAPGY